MSRLFFGGLGLFVFDTSVVVGVVDACGQVLEEAQAVTDAAPAEPYGCDGPEDCCDDQVGPLEIRAPPAVRPGRDAVPDDDGQNGDDEDDDEYYDDYDECGFNPYMGCYDYDC